MIRYTAVGKTVRELKDRLQDLCDHGMGEDTIQALILMYWNGWR